MGQPGVRLDSDSQEVPKPTYKRCRECGATREDAGLLSHDRLCGVCADRLVRENNDGLHYKTGPAFLKWRRQMAASVGAVLLDDNRESA